MSGLVEALSPENVIVLYWPVYKKSLRGVVCAWCTDPLLPSLFEHELSAGEPPQMHQDTSIWTCVDTLLSAGFNVAVKSMVEAPGFDKAWRVSGSRGHTIGHTSA